LSSENTVTRRSFLAGAAGVAATGALGGLPALADAKVHRHFRTPLWRTAYRRGVIYGSSISTWMYQDDPAYHRLFRREAAICWPEDDMLWYHVKPTPDAPIDFTYPDMIVEFARRNRQLFIGGPGLVWDEGFGDGWEPDLAWSLSEREARHILFGTLRAMVRRYRGRVQAWVVCNEVTSPEGKGGLRKDVPWYNTIGPSYVAEAFRYAHQEDPHALLVLNEFGLDTVNDFGDEPVPRQRALLQVVDRLRRRGVPIHAIGIQAHLLSTQFEHFHPHQFRHFLHEIAQRGLKILVTEMDVLDHAFPPAIKPRDRGVAEIYKRYLDVVLQEKAVISVIGFGVSDRWTEENDDNPRDDGVPERPLPFDDDLRPKPAFYAMQRAFRHAPHRRPYWTPLKLRHH
jgi:endo-1,4-beta-xylanase